MEDGGELGGGVEGVGSGFDVGGIELELCLAVERSACGELGGDKRVNFFVGFVGNQRSFCLLFG